MDFDSDRLTRYCPDGQPHCDHWVEDGPCCRCGDNSDTRDTTGQP